MKRLIIVACSCLLAAACSGTPGSSNPASLAIPSDAGQAALTQLCDSSSSTSIKGVADQLSSFDAGSVDTSQLSASLNTLTSNLEGASVNSSQQALKGTAIAAVDNLRSALADPNTASQAASSAASALNALNASLCS